MIRGLEINAKMELHMGEKMATQHQAYGGILHSGTLSLCTPLRGWLLQSSISLGSENHDWTPAVSYSLVHLYLSDTIRPFKYQSLKEPQCIKKSKEEHPKASFHSLPRFSTQPTAQLGVTHPALSPGPPTPSHLRACKHCLEEPWRMSRLATY